jgi:hypothetical protein
MEIKRTVLPPFGGPREESGANGSLWSMGGKIIGSPADGVVVPNIVGLSTIEAIDLLTSLGLAHDTGQSIYVGATQENNGMVASQSPTAGTLVNIGSTVVYSSFSYSSSVVPNLIGEPAANAVNILLSVGLDALNTSTSMYYQGAIINYQSPIAGTLVSPGSVVEYRYPDQVIFYGGGQDFGGEDSIFIAGSYPNRGEFVLDFASASLLNRVLARNDWQTVITGADIGSVSGVWPIVNESSDRNRIRFSRPSNWDTAFAANFGYEYYYLNNVTFDNDLGIITVSVSS